MDVNVFLLGINVLVFVVGGGMYMIIPQLTRKAYLFGVKIPPEESSSPEARQMKRRYALTCLVGILAALFLCVALFVLWREHMLLATLYLPLLIAPIYLAAFIPNWKRAVRLKEERGWAVSNLLYAETRTGHERGNLSALPWTWYILCFAVVMATIAIAIVRQPLLTELIPVHFGFDGNPTRWAEPTWGNLVQIPLINIGVLVMFALGAIALEKSKLQIDPDNPARSFAQHRLYRRRLGNALGFGLLCIILMFAITDVPMLYDTAWAVELVRLATPITLIFPLVAFIPVVVVSVKSGQGGCKIKVDDSPETSDADGGQRPKVAGRGDDRRWKLGLFYYIAVSCAVRNKKCTKSRVSRPIIFRTVGKTAITPMTRLLWLNHGLVPVFVLTMRTRL